MKNVVLTYIEIHSFKMVNTKPYKNTYINGGGFHDKLEAELGTQNPSNECLATFIYRSG